MKLHDKEYFNKLVNNIVMWSLIVTLLIVLVLVISFPVYLAMEYHTAWLLLYILYAAGIFVAALVAAQGKDENNENR